MAAMKRAAELQKSGKLTSFWPHSKKFIRLRTQLLLEPQKASNNSQLPNTCKQTSYAKSAEFTLCEIQYQEVPKQAKSYLTVPALLVKFSCSLAFSEGPAQLCDQSVGPKQRPCLPPRLIRHLALRVCVLGVGGRWEGVGKANQTLVFVDQTAFWHKDSSVWGLEVSVSHSVSPIHDALVSRFTYPHLPVPLLCPSTSIWFSLLG